MNDAVLEIEGLTVRSAEGDALVKNVGLCLKRQECLGIAGESGSGKTITAKAILHLLPQDLTASVTHLRVLGKRSGVYFWARKSVLYRRTRWLICIP